MVSSGSRWVLGGVCAQVLVIRGPDKGKMGRVIWLYDQLTATVKLEPNPLLGGSDIRSFREVGRW